jgi:uncharacterized membrane protein YdbT with pleckstrin-like domain
VTDGLLPEEGIVVRARRHWIVAMKPMLPPLVALPLWVFLDLGLLRGLLAADFQLLALLALLHATGLWAIVVWVRWISTRFTLTDQRVILEVGLVARGSRVIALDRVQNVSTRQGVAGRLLGYGHVEIDAAGSSGKEILEYLPHPGGFRDQVFAQAERLRRAPAAFAR